jgi:hypothetical protein
MRDWTVDTRGKVVQGSREKPRRFSEYWTFVRAAGQPVEAERDLGSCPNCGAPLDKVGQQGECGYCGTIITTGDFDWVVALIEQDEVYRG